MSKQIESSKQSRLSLAYSNLVEEQQQDKFVELMTKQLWPIGKVDLTKPSPEVRAAINYTLTDEQGESRQLEDIKREMVAFTNHQAAEADHRLEKLISWIKQK